jgi:hypothetical protein
MSRLCLYFSNDPVLDRWLPGDRFVRPLFRRIVRGRPKFFGGVERIFLNLTTGLDRLGIEYEVNLPFLELKDDDRVGVVGRTRSVLSGYKRSNRIVAGPYLMTHPSEWPNLCAEYPIARYLQHSKWANEVYVPYYGDRCSIWTVGIDTEKWKPGPTHYKVTDFLIYDKIRWNYGQLHGELMQPILKELEKRNLTCETIRYGSYGPADFQGALTRCRAMIFLCEHESQGIAYQECLSSGVPVLAWDQGWCLDPNRFKWGQPEIPATSVPLFDHRCGMRFLNAGEFSDQLDQFMEKLHAGSFKPREYVLENLTLEKCSLDYCKILGELSSAQT